MKSTSCEILFPNNPSRVFFSGQMLHGLVVLKLTKPKTVKGIYVKIIGRAYCRWTSGAGHHSRIHVGEEFYLNEKTFLVDDRSGEVVLTPKQYNYTFSCMLPAALPTSVEGNTGRIRYSVSVHIDKPLWSVQRAQQHFTVIKPLNLNDEILLRLPIAIEDRKTFLTCRLLLCCKSGQLVINGSLPVRGYVPGQTIDLLLQVSNRSDQSVQNFIIRIIKHIQYHPHANSSTTKCDDSVIKTVSCIGCSRNEFKTFNLSITVPSVPPTDESTSNIVKVSYRLQIQGLVGCFHEDPILTFPIKIGTYPILLSNISITQFPSITSTATNVASNQENYGNQNYSTPSAMVNFSNSSGSSLDSCIDPPTYEEAISTYAAGADNGIDDEFRPSYPVFRRTPSYVLKSNANA